MNWLLLFQRYAFWQEFYDKHSIVPEKAEPEHSSCSISFSEKDQKYYGWSHRAYHGFGIGDEITSEDDCASELLPIGFKAKTLEDCKKMAKAFARSVS